MEQMTVKQALKLILELAQNNSITPEMVDVEPALEDEYRRQEEAVAVVEKFTSLL